MKQQNDSEPTDPQLIEKAKKDKSNATINAVFIGFLVGIIVWSAANKAIGFFTLIPLGIIYMLVNKSRKSGDSEE